MPSSAQVSFISTPFSHFNTSTLSSNLCEELTSFKVSSLIADFIDFWSQGTLHLETKPIKKQVKERNFQAGFSKTFNEEISELINGYIIAKSMLQTERGETGNKLKISQDLFAKVFGLVGHKTAQKIILAICDLMAQGVLQSKGKASQNHLYIIYSFILRSLPLVNNIPFQSKEFFNIFELFMFKAPLIQEHQLWCSYIKDNQSNDHVKNQMVLKSDYRQQSKEYSDDNVVEDLENHDKCSTASRSSITTHERNSEFLDIESGNILEFGLTFSSPQKPNFELEKIQTVFEIYEGFFMGDLDIDFNPSDNHLSNFDQEKKSTYSSSYFQKSNFNHHQYQQYQQSPYYPAPNQRPEQQPKPKNQEIIQLKLFTLPQTNQMMGYPSSSFPNQNHMMGYPSSNIPTQQRIKNNVHHQASSTKDSLNPKTKVQAKNNQKPKEKILPKPKKQEEKGFKLWDMISVNGKLKKN